ncbi:hypothetical protein DSO57_1028355 [Entomophthora muscae]|uniref:Uncharacterized protein n=1 Tax=Entomophthora muscae TaxID=34485 RepID=A0ACC2UNH9_9FUNG|nr:hypothetical protein DSO57_1028355 [Entomophthora muscae]
MGVIDTTVLAAGPWLWVGKSMSYLIKLPPILWWALPTQSATHLFPNASELADQGWFPDSEGIWKVYDEFGEGDKGRKLVIQLGVGFVTKTIEQCNEELSISAV